MPRLATRSAGEALVPARAAKAGAESLRYAVLAAAFAVSVYPVFWMVTTGMKSPREAADWWGLPGTVRLANFAEVWGTGRFLTCFLNSVLVTSAAVVLTVALASPAGYALARMRFRGRRAAFCVFLGGMMVPVHVTLIPLLRLMRATGLHDTRAGLVMVYVAWSLPLAVVLLAAFFRDVPAELEEAAAIDGCDGWRTFVYIALPVAKPAVAGVAMLTLVNVWNEFVFALVLLQDESKITVPLGIMNLRGEFGGNVPLMAAALTAAVAPPLLVYVFAQRHLVRGLTAGAAKG